MPFVSQAQRAFMYANDPKMAEEFESKTPKGKKLPKRVKKFIEKLQKYNRQRIEKNAL